MRAKQLEVIKLRNNHQMGKSMNSIIYNLAFSPKIRVIDVQGFSVGDKDFTEAIYKLMKISGAIEYLNLKHSGIQAHINTDFAKALGENKTLRYLDMDSSSKVSTLSIITFMAKAVAMNAFRNGVLEVLSIRKWISSGAQFKVFIQGLLISKKDHEEWYGDKKLASEMEKEDLEKNLFCKLKQLNFDECVVSGIGVNYKELLKKEKPDWPNVLKLVTMQDMALSFKKSSFTAKDMETFAYMLHDNPFGASKIKSLNLQLNNIMKEGAKTLAPALKANSSLITLNLSSCKLGVSGMKSLSDALATNTTLQNLNLYRNVFDVDGARALGNALKTNTSIKFLDIGHNRIRFMGLKSLVEGILTNNGSQVSDLSIKWNFITDEGFTYLFNELVLPKQGRV